MQLDSASCSACESSWEAAEELCGAWGNKPWRHCHCDLRDSRFLMWSGDLPGGQNGSRGKTSSHKHNQRTDTMCNENVIAGKVALLRFDSHSAVRAAAAETTRPVFPVASSLPVKNTSRRCVSFACADGDASLCCWQLIMLNAKMPHDAAVLKEWPWEINENKVLQYV